MSIFALVKAVALSTAGIAPTQVSETASPAAAVNTNILPVGKLAPLNGRTVLLTDTAKLDAFMGSAEYQIAYTPAVLMIILGLPAVWTIPPNSVP